MTPERQIDEQYPDFVPGKIHNLMTWNRELSPGEIRQLYETCDERFSVTVENRTGQGNGPGP